MKMPRARSKVSPDVRRKPAGTVERAPREEEQAWLPLEGDRRDIGLREDLGAGGSPPDTTQVADGLPRRAWTVDEVERMVEVGILCEPEPFELIGGELVAMAPKHRHHEVVRTELHLFWGDRRAHDLKI